MGYSFGDDDIAAQRLGHLAGVYATSSGALLRERAPRKPRLAVDVGCGPGHTTRLLRDVSGAATTVGVDSSSRYMEHARRGDGDGISYVQADVSRGLPDAVAGAELLYCRFLLTHLADPLAALRSWRPRAAAAGVLVVEELEWIRSEHPALGRYYGLVETVQEARGQAMYVGATVTDLVEAAGWQVLHSAAVRLEPAAPSMALLHSLNLQTLRRDPALASLPAGELDDLARDLEAVAQGRVAASVDNGMRQVVAVCGR